MIPGDVKYSKYYKIWINRKYEEFFAYAYIVLYFKVPQNIFNVCYLGYIILFSD